jgi:hypothetical protein
MKAQCYLSFKSYRLFIIFIFNGRLPIDRHPLGLNEGTLCRTNKCSGRDLGHQSSTDVATARARRSNVRSERAVTGKKVNGEKHSRQHAKYLQRGEQRQFPKPRTDVFDRELTQLSDRERYEPRRVDSIKVEKGKANLQDGHQTPVCSHVTRLQETRPSLQIST